MGTMPARDDHPRSAVEVYSDQALLDPWHCYRELRDAGPVVFLERYGMYAATRYSVVDHILRTPDVFPSGEGVMMNDEMNSVLRGNTLCSDGDAHEANRRVILRPLRPPALRPLQERIRAEARMVVDRVVGRRVDAVVEIAQHLPVTVVSDLVGLPERGRERMLVWASEMFNCFGPMSDRTRSSFSVLGEMMQYATDEAVPGKLKPGSWAEAVHDAAGRGEVAPEACPVMMIDYMGPSLDTTIFAISSAIWLFANHPEQWDAVRADRSLIPSAVNEVLRIESPIQDFSRSVAVDHEIDGVRLPAGARVITFYGAGNRDERRYVDPDSFDVRRDAADHLGFGAGPHQCVGLNLAKLEMRAVFEALADRVRAFELHHEERALHNILRGFTRLEVTPHP
ncbi:cytochrome P450 [Pseudonocardia alni]|uniref:cytochrome P450 n=1 Tax=Pseudonocardia alni TaxID=33907 RepID=UPI00280BFF9F|nr:cytochrome P450 [Pseudonocardia alni]